MKLHSVFRAAALIALLIVTWSAPVAAQRAQSFARDMTTRTLAYHEITAFTVSPNTRGEEAPIISDDGHRIAYAVAPGTGDPATPNRIFMMNVDGSGTQEVDSYVSLCYCGSSIDLSADGGTVISTDSVQVRIADSGGSRELISLGSNEINAARISGDGSLVFFRVYRDTSIRDSSPAQAIERGLWVINADGSGLRQIVSPDHLVALGLPPTDFFGSNSATIDASTDGSRVIFGAFHEPESAGFGQGLFGVQLDGSGLHELIGRVAFVISAGISPDGATVAYSSVDVTTDLQEAGVLPFAGGTPTILIAGGADLPVSNGGLPASYDRMQLTTEGGMVVLGASGLLADTATGDLLALGVRAPTLVPGAAPLITDGLPAATMDASGRRFLYVNTDATGILQLVIVDLDPDDLGMAPQLTDAGIDPASVPVNRGSTATVEVQVTSPGPVLGVGAMVMRDGLADPNVGLYQLIDDGAHEDGAAEDGVFASDAVAADCCAAVGPRSVRASAETDGPDGMRHATAIDFEPFAVEAAGT